MSSERVPSRSEVMGWSPQQLADYLRRMNLTGCDRVVLKNSISGSRFVNLSDNDLQKFPKPYAPMVSKFSCEISKKEEKKGLFGLKSTKHYEPAEVVGWDEDEFDDDDNDYESPYSGDEAGSGGDYESPNEDVDPANDYEPPPVEPDEDTKLMPTMPLQDGDYIDNHVVNRNQRPDVPSRPPVPTPSLRMPGESPSRRDASPRPPGKFPPGPPPIVRDNKPSMNMKPKLGRDPGSNPSPIGGSYRPTLNQPSPQSRRSHSDASDSGKWSQTPPLSSNPTRPPTNRFDGRREQPHDEAQKHNTYPLRNPSCPPRPGPPISRPGDKIHHSHSGGSLPHKLSSGDRSSFRPPPPTAQQRTQELDPRWYVGKVTRGQAEKCLIRVHKDGAYLVRDSTRQQANQPFTLMVFYQGKVYNIQIRQQNQQFQLGTGLKAQESFPSVSDIINHYSQSPLLLIDAKNRTSGQQNQCQLCDPVGYYMTGQNWS